MSGWIYYLGGDSADGKYIDGDDEWANIILVVIVMVNILMVVLILIICENAHLTSDGIGNLMMSGESLIHDRNGDSVMLVMTVKTIAETEQDHNLLKMTIDQRW